MTQPGQKLKPANPFLYGEVQPFPPDLPAQQTDRSPVNVPQGSAWWQDRKNQVICGLSAGALILLGLTLRESSAPVGQYA
ncbi:MAG: hypothetical protein AAFV72_21915, partial [Cyanobacteria bacterium J06635_1]